MTWQFQGASGLVSSTPSGDEHRRGYALAALPRTDVASTPNAIRQAWWCRAPGPRARARRPRGAARRESLPRGRRAATLPRGRSRRPPSGVSVVEDRHRDAAAFTGAMSAPGHVARSDHASDAVSSHCGATAVRSVSAAASRHQRAGGRRHIRVAAQSQSPGVPPPPLGRPDNKKRRQAELSASGLVRGRGPWSTTTVVSLRAASAAQPKSGRASGP